MYNRVLEGASSTRMDTTVKQNELNDKLKVEYIQMLKFSRIIKRPKIRRLYISCVVHHFKNLTDKDIRNPRSLYSILDKGKFYSYTFEDFTNDTGIELSVSCKKTLKENFVCILKSGWPDEPTSRTRNSINYEFFVKFSDWVRTSIFKSGVDL